MLVLIIENAFEPYHLNLIMFYTLLEVTFSLCGRSYCRSLL